MTEAIGSLSARDARRLALHAQGFLGPRSAGGPTSMLRRVGAVQIDTISVLARSHELVAYARQGAVARTTIEAAYWGPNSATFEYWSHAACVLPLEDWPLYAFKRRAMKARGRRWHVLENESKSCGAVLDRLRDEGPLTARQLGGAKKGGVWWDWSETKIAAEWLLDIGELVCRERRGFQRVYDLAERAIPEAIADHDLTDAECARSLVSQAGRALGVATVTDLAVYHGVPVKQVQAVVADTDLVPVNVEGWSQPGYLDPSSSHVLEGRLRGRTLLLSPFDSLTWDRPRTARVFDFHHRLEAYTPQHKRLHGYFAMPVLAGTKFVGLVDPGRRGQTFVAKQITLQTRDAARHVAGALVEAATWVGSEGISIERVEPAERTAEMNDAMAERQ